MLRPSAYREVNCSNKLGLQDRIRVIKAYKKQYAYSKLATQFKCSVYQLRSIMRNKRKIIREYAQSKEYLAYKNVKAADSENILFLEKVLYEWFRRAQRHRETGPITNEMFMKKIEEAVQIFGVKSLEANLDWLLAFRKKYEITDLDMTMLRIDNDDMPLSMDFKEIIVYVANQDPFTKHFAHIFAESLSDLEDSDLELDSPNEGVCLVQAVSVAAFETPPIMNDEQARRYLKPLEEYVLMKENFRAIGLVEQLEDIFSSADSK